VTREHVDEMHLLDGWLRRHTEQLAIIPVDPAEPLAALDAIMTSLRPPRARVPSPSAVPSPSGRGLG
jgi:hypothetical protein